MATKLATKTRTPHDYWVEAAQTESLCFLRFSQEPPHKCSVCADSPYILACPRRYLSAIFGEFVLYILATILATGFAKNKKPPGVAAEGLLQEGIKMSYSLLWAVKM